MTVFAESIEEFTIPEILDEAAQDAGDRELCSPKSYSLDVPNAIKGAIKFNPESLVISVQSKDLKEAGKHSIDIVASFDNYPSIPE